MLLHLISKAKINIEDISINDITRQYLDYLHEMQKFDIDIASEFLVMASNLLYIKSSKLIPNKTLPDDNQEIQTKEQLIQKLLDYKRYKEVSGYLKQRYHTYGKIYYKLPEEIVSQDIDSSLLIGLSKKDLYNTFFSLLNKKGDMKKQAVVHEITRESISIIDKKYDLKCIIDRCSEITFYSLFDGYYDRSDIIVSFLAILELINDNYIELYQARPFDDITIRKRKIING